MNTRKNKYCNLACKTNRILQPSLTHLRLTVFAKSVPSGLAVFSLFKKIIKKKVLKILL